jgi:hypothetical protein
MEILVNTIQYAQPADQLCAAESATVIQKPIEEGQRAARLARERAANTKMPEVMA